MKTKLIPVHMQTAYNYAQLSSARRLKVGAIIVKDNRIISIGYNGMPEGWDNNCEYKEYDLSRDLNWQVFPGSEEFYPHTDELGQYALKTKPQVLHAEMNAIGKLARSSESGDGASMFITHSPCTECAKLIHVSGIRRVFYGEEYRNRAGVDFLKQCGIDTVKVDMQR